MNLYQLKKIGRIVAKIILALGIAGLIGYVGYSLFLSIYYKPKFVTVTNITGNSATISWITDVPLTGKVLYKTEDNILPWPLSLFNTEKAYDDRDFNNAEFEMYSGNPIATEDVKVKDLGKYKAHHITIRDLEESSTYYIAIQNGWYTYRVDISSITTYSTPTTAPTPQPIFGSVVDESGNPISNSIVYITPAQKGTDMNVLSAVTNGMGGWYIDISSTRNSNGDIVTLEETNDTFKAFVRLDSEYYSDIQDYVFGYFDGGYEDILVKKQENINSLNIFNRLIGNIYAYDSDDRHNAIVSNTTTTTSSYKDVDMEKASHWNVKTGSYSKVTNNNTSNTSEGQNSGGSSEKVNKTTKVGSYTINNWSKLTSEQKKEYATKEPGNASKLQALSNNGTLTYNLMHEIGLANNEVQYAANISAVTGKGITASSVIANGSTNISAIYNTKTGWSYTEKSVEPESVEFLISCTKNNCGKASNTSMSISYLFDSISFEKLRTQLLLKGYNPKSSSRDRDKTYISYSINSDNLKNFVDEIINISEKFKTTNTGSEEESSYIVGTNMGVEIYKSCSARVGDYESCVEEVVQKYQNIIDGENFFTFWGVNPYLNYSINEQVEDAVIEAGVDGCDSGVGSVNISSSSSVLVFCKDSSENKKTVLTAEEIEKDILKSNYDLNLGTYAKKLDREDLYNKVEDSYSMRSLSGYPTSKLMSYSGELVSALGIKDEKTNLIEEVLKSDEFKACLDGSCKDAEKVADVYNKFDKSILGFDSKAIVTEDGKVEIYYINTALENQLETRKEEKDNPVLGLVSKAYASDNTNNSDSGYIYYLPEKGFYDIQIGDESLGKTISNDGTGYIFYLEVNGIDGLQVPDDPENPKYWEDIIFDSSALGVKYSKVSDTFDINLKKGINLISFDFVPSRSKTEVYTSSQLILDATQSGIRLEYVSYFDSGKWSTGIKCTDSTCMGNNFVIVPGQGYLLYASEDGTLSVPGYDLESSAPISLYEGWNLVGINGYEKSYTAKSLLTSINSITGMTADNVTWWPTSLGRYTGFEYTNGKEYGTDYAIFDNNAYFIRVTDLKPTNTKCTAIIWQEGGTLHGTCGSTSSVKSSTSQVTTNITASSGETVYLTSKDVKSVALKVGDTLAVQGVEQPTTGYTLEDPVYDKTYFTLVDTKKTDESVVSTNKDGAHSVGGTKYRYEWQFKAIKKGSTNVVINYSQSSSKESSRVEQINATITIK